MAPQLDATQRVLIRTLLTEGFETKLKALEASCTMRAVQRIRQERQQSEMPTRRTSRLGRCIAASLAAGDKGVHMATAEFLWVSTGFHGLRFGP
jgi:hypothetical protein